MNCKFEVVVPGLVRCANCGREVHSNESPQRIHARCNAASNRSAVSRPSAAKRAYNFAVAAIAHAVRGAPTCTQEQIDGRLAICKSCPLFDGSICRHADCGCRIGQQRKFLNKLAWADQSCPIGKWEATSAEGSNPQQNEEMNHE